MNRCFLLFTLLFFYVLPFAGFGQGCDDWAKITSSLSGIKIGDLDVKGNRITVEAVFNRTAPYSGAQVYAGDLVSKHEDPNTVNYLLRPNSGEITTTNGYFKTPDICDIELNKTYHVAMVYDGKELRFYRNGYLMSKIACTGNLYQNDFITSIGTFAYDPNTTNENLVGYINEVRIWNVARSQSDIKKYMNQSLPNPQSQTGLLAYYTFDDLKNKQGNSQWNGSILGDGKINQVNPTCSSFVADSCGTKSSNVIASFTGVDSVCKNQSVQFNNTSVGASNYYWSFCAAGFNTTPAADNIGDPGNLLQAPVFMDYALDDDGNYYGFISNYSNGHIVRLNYGTSLLNKPTATDLGNFSLIPIYAEGIQVKKANGKCYAFVVSAGNAEGTNSVLVRLDFGASFSNKPEATSLGNIGNLFFPHDLFITQENGNFYGFTININDNTITRFDFGYDLSNTPSGTNLGSIGDFDYPCGFSFVNVNANWYAFVTNRDGNSITRLDFGNSLTNVPTGTNIGNPGGYLNRPRDISIFQSCDGVIGLVVNEEDEQTGTITKLDFNNSVTSIPGATNLGNLGSMKFPHSISKFFIEGNDIYSFVTNVSNNTITRLRYAGCSGINIPSSQQFTPPPVTYTQPGIYNVNLLVDVGLPTQTSYCKQIVVIDCDTTCNLKSAFSYEQKTCDAKSVQFHSESLGADSVWWDFGDGQTAGNIKDTIIEYASFNKYIVHLYSKTNAGCLDTLTNTINVSIKKDSAVITNDTSICPGNAIQLNAVNGLSYCWSPSTGLSNASIQNPIAKPTVTTIYYLNVLVDSGKPVVQDSVIIKVINPPIVNAGKDISICKGDSVQLSASGAIKYNWNASAYLSDTTIAAPVAKPQQTTSFVVTGYNLQGCSGFDTIQIKVLSLPVIQLINDTAICAGGSVLLRATSAGTNKYRWSPSKGLSNPEIYNPVASPADTTKYFVTATDANGCKSMDSVNVSVLNVPVVATINDTTVCSGTAIILNTNADYANIFKWSPQTGLNNPLSQSPQLSTSINTLYKVSASNGICSTEDSVMVNVLALPEVKASNDTTVCGNASTQLNASGAISYLWSPSTGLSSVNIPNPIASPGATTTYYVTGTANNSCTNKDSVTMVVHPPANLEVKQSATYVCLGDSALVTASGGDIYQWLPPLGTISNPSDSVTYVFPSVNTTYKVVVTNIACKVRDTLAANIDVKPLPIVKMSKSNDIDCLSFNAQLSASGGLSYKWYPSTYISNTNIKSPTVNPPSDTWYAVTIKDENNCRNTDSILVKSILNPDAARFDIANAFTPNGDGVNDCFSVKYWGPADVFDLSIYNRFGQMVFHSKNIGECWDGIFKGQPQPVGTYVYKIIVSTKCSLGVLHKNGTLVLIR